MGSYAEEQLINALEKEIATFKAKKIICDCTECKYNKCFTCTSDNLMISKGYCMSSSEKQEGTGEKEGRRLYHPEGVE